MISIVGAWHTIGGYLVWKGKENSQRTLLMILNLGLSKQLKDILFGNENSHLFYDENGQPFCLLLLNASNLFSPSILCLSYAHFF
jgi:hypothetical protein